MLQATAEPRRIRELVSGDDTKQILSKTLARMGAGARVDGLALTRCKFKPNRTLRASYDAVVDGRTWPFVVTWHQPHSDGASRQLPIAGGDVDDAAFHPFSAFASYAPGLDASLMLWPYDPAFSQLPQLIQRCRDDDRTVAAVRYRPGERHVLRVDTAGTGPSEFVKVERNGEVCHIETVLAAIDDATAGGFVEPWTRAMLVGPNSVATRANGAPTYLETAGIPLSRLVDPASVPQVLGSVGRLAATLHTIDVADLDGLPRRSVEQELALVARATEHIAYLDPELAAPIAGVLLEVGRRMEPAAPDRLVHGDLKLDHVFVSTDGVRLIDLDDFRLADPASDIAKLMAELRFLSVDQARPGTDRAAQRFAAAYEAIGDPKVIERGQLLVPALLLKMAARRIPIVDPRWHRRVKAIIDEACRLCAQGPGRDR